MLKHLRLRNVGPAPELAIELAPRLNLITGDNGLGMSFLLDVAFWAMTRRWPGEVNTGLSGSRKAQPLRSGDAQIGFSFTGKTTTNEYVSQYQRREEAWTGPPGRPANPGLVIYALSDGSFAVWDPARNYWQTREQADVQERVPAYVFSPSEVWNGLESRALAQSPGAYAGRSNEAGDRPLCLGLVMDWANWQKERSDAFAILSRVLKALSPSSREVLRPGDLVRVSIDDARDIPTVRMAYGVDVPVVHASAGIRRILALAYIMVWAWQEHRRAAQLLDEPPAQQMVMLIDEVESHLHPQWQRKVAPALLDVATALAGPDTDLQLIATTHSPLVMASVEPLLDRARDRLWVLKLERRKVVLRAQEIMPLGDAERWLTSTAFELTSSRSTQTEVLLRKATAMLDAQGVEPTKIAAMHRRLSGALSPTDEFLFNWRYVCKSRGWLS